MAQVVLSEFYQGKAVDRKKKLVGEELLSGVVSLSRLTDGHYSLVYFRESVESTSYRGAT